MLLVLCSKGKVNCRNVGIEEKKDVDVMGNIYKEYSTAFLTFILNALLTFVWSWCNLVLKQPINSTAQPHLLFSSNILGHYVHLL